MPIERIPVVHKFGIISHSQRLELQERLLKQSYLSSIQSKRSQITNRNPIEVTEEFVQHFNGAESLNEKVKLEETASKMLFRIKRRAGVRDGGEGEHVDLAVAWTELSQLAQCKGKIQDECLDVLIMSLDQAPINKIHIPVLFFLAETTLYWLRTDSVNQPYLRTGELKLLRMGQLTFTRLFYHHMAGQLQGHEEFKNRLCTYLDGFSDCQESYNPYPNALLNIRYISEVGKIIVGDCNTEAGEIKEGDKIATETNNTGSEEDNQMLQEMSTQYDDTRSTHSAAISSSVHDLSPTLWHALDVWRCVHQLGGGLPDALKALGNCGVGLANETWADGVCALHVLADASRCSLSALKTLQGLACGVRPAPAVHNSTSPTQAQEEAGRVDTEVTQSTGTKNSNAPLSDIYERTETGTTSKTGPRWSSLSAPGASPLKSGSQSPHRLTVPLDSTPVTTQSPTKGAEEAKSGTTSRGPSRHKTQESMKTSSYYDTMPNTAWKAEVGTDLPEGRASQTSSVETFGNVVHPELPGLHGWHWEVAITYAEALADICLHSSTSNIQKVALLGTHKDPADLRKTGRLTQCPMKSAGLLDLVYFIAADEDHDGGPNDWSWRVRYTSLQGLVKLCKCCESDPTKEGLRTVAWNALVHANSTERDLRVLEALKVGQVDASIENLIREQVVVEFATIGSKIAAGLSALYLPPLPPPVEKTPRRTSQKPKKKSAGPSKPVESKQLRTSLRDEINLANALHEPAPNYHTRTNFDLKRLVEDQWRKELQVQLSEEEEERAKELVQKQEQREREERESEDKRRQKLGHKYQGKAYDVPSETCSKPIKKSSKTSLRV